MPLVYIETSIVSHATAIRSSDPAMAVLQDQAKQWMQEQSKLYDLVTSQLVLSEARRGDRDAARRRLEMLANIPVLDDNPDVEYLADQLLSRSLIPKNARLDALHVASAALAGVQYLLTQNCRHIANAHVLPRVYKLLDELGVAGMLIVTPFEFLGGNDDESNS
ncbi:PIN domain-containing protein [Aeoliella sp. SH292]|uniref:PIN domain-containing protein n=1 Tax=Aeoliella sp. SH292 TaxID=3454464 RepID=UPI003F94B08B